MINTGAFQKVNPFTSNPSQLHRSWHQGDGVKDDVDPLHPSVQGCVLGIRATHFEPFVAPPKNGIIHQSSGCF